MSNSTSLPEGYAEGSWWYYAPNKGAPIAVAILFLISGIWHLYQCHRFNSWKSTGAVPFAALIFIAGYSVRAAGAWDYQNSNLWIASSIMLLCSPPVYEAANFFTLARILYYVPYHAPLHPGRMVFTFATLQSTIESLNGNGASKAINPNDTSQQRAGRAVLQTSLILQLFSMSCFIGIALRYEYNCRRAGLFPDNLRSALRVLYVSAALISVRTLYRTVEWFETGDIVGSDPSSFAPVLQREWYFWVFEASMMLANTFLLNFFHSSHYLPSNLKIYLAPDGVTEKEGRGFKEVRKWYWALFDPFDIYGLITKRDQKREAWMEPEVPGTPNSDQSSVMEKVPWNEKNQDALVRIV